MTGLTNENADRATVSRFIMDWISRYGIMGELICDNGIYFLFLFWLLYILMTGIS